METITSRDNKFLKFARKVRDGHRKTHMFIEGKRLVEEAIASGVRFDVSFVSESLIGEHLSTAVHAISDSCFAVSERLINTIADTRSPQGIMGIAMRPRHTISEMEMSNYANRAKIPIIVLLNEVNNPSNLGAIVRTSEAAGAIGVITTPNAADAYSPKAIRAAMGSAFRLPVCENISISEAITFALQENMEPVITAANGSVFHTNHDWTKPALVIFGSEAHGLNWSNFTGKHTTITIPIKKPVESLNLAVAAGIILFEAQRQNA